MSRVYDNWERLVGAVLKREELRRIALCESFSSSSSADFSSRFSVDSALEDVPAASGISSESFDPTTHSSDCGVQRIKFKEIKKATKNFLPYMWTGQESRGLVFKGWIDEHTLSASKPGSGMAVAVKKWKRKSMQEHHEFLKKINHVGQLRHPNLVKLIGYSSDEDNMILVTEFMAKGRLDNHLFRRGHESLCWETRIKVALGAARALSFLHDLSEPLIPQDFTTADFLLDGDFNAKLVYFHLATDGPSSDMICATSHVTPTNGYAAPEYIATGHFTTKCYVFGFGVVLLELLSGRRVLDTNRPAEDQNLVEWAKPYLGDKRELLKVMDTRLNGQYTHNVAYTVSKLAYQCLSTVPEERPRMAEVVVVLEQIYCLKTI